MMLMQWLADQASLPVSKVAGSPSVLNSADKQLLLALVTFLSKWWHSHYIFHTMLKVLEFILLD